MGEDTVYTPVTRRPQFNCNALKLDVNIHYTTKSFKILFILL